MSTFDPFIVLFSFRGREYGDLMLSVNWVILSVLAIGDVYFAEKGVDTPLWQWP
jgi:hypothetical protein